MTLYCTFNKPPKSTKNRETQPETALTSEHQNQVISFTSLSPSTADSSQNPTTTKTHISNISSNSFPYLKAIKSLQSFYL